MKKNEGISKRSIQSLILFFADPNSKDSIPKKYQKNNKNTENGGSKSTASACKSKRVTRLKKKENLGSTTYDICVNYFKKENTKLHNNAATNLKDNKRHTAEMLNQNNIIAQTDKRS